MTSIATNVAAVRVQYHGKINTKIETEAFTRLASGIRVTNASDDAAGLFIASRMKAQISGLERAVQNSADGMSLVNTVEANLNEIRNMVLRMREIAVQMANGIYADNPDRGFAQIEIDQLLQQIDLIAQNANFNGVALLDGSMQRVDTLHAPVKKCNTIKIGILSNQIDLLQKLINFNLRETSIWIVGIDSVCHLHRNFAHPQYHVTNFIKVGFNCVN